MEKNTTRNTKPEKKAAGKLPNVTRTILSTSYSMLHTAHSVRRIPYSMVRTSQLEQSTKGESHGHSEGSEESCPPTEKPLRFAQGVEEKRFIPHPPAEQSAPQRRTPLRVLFKFLSIVLHIRFILLFVVFVAAEARAERAAPQIWLVSTRCAPHCGDLENALDCLSYCRLDEDSQWSPSDADEFFHSDCVKTPTVVFLHGNWNNAKQAERKGWYVFDGISEQSDCRAFRYVIWSWPADLTSIRGPKDARLKICYCDAESFYLAKWLNRLKPESQISLIGHSFGSRIIAGALHLLGGGEVACRRMPESTAEKWKEKRNSVGVVMLAPAIDADSLSAGGCYNCSLQLIGRMLLACNGCDPILRRYSRLHGRGGPEALGYIGPCGLDEEKVATVDVSAAVGRRHDWRLYSSAPGVYDRWLHYTFLEE